MQAPVFFSAQKVAARLGLSSQDLEYLREENLREGTDWLTEGEDVLLTRTGLENVLSHLSGSSNTLQDFTEDQAPAPDPVREQRGARSGPRPPSDQRPGELVELTVARILPNFRLLEASTGSGEMVTVSVKNNRNFMPRMVLKARLLRVDRYEFEGQLPRRRGRY